jgi:hypothetical protein
MKGLEIFNLNLFGITATGILTLSNFLVVLFGHTIPTVTGSFFRDVIGMVIIGAVFIFALMWLLKARPHNRPKNYSIICYDVFGNESKIDGIRTEFKIHDVAWSFMKSYKKSYPLHNFALVSEHPSSNKKTIYRYI